MNNIERLKKIDDFFNNLTIEEFEKKLVAAGINEIDSSSNDYMELSLSLTYTNDPNMENVYNKNKYGVNNEGSNNYFFSEDYAKAV